MSLYINNNIFNQNLASETNSTWTPSLVGTATIGNLTYSARQGLFVKTGSQVTVTFNLVISNILTLPVGVVNIQGIPHPAKNVANAFWTGSVRYKMGVLSAPSVLSISAGSNSITLNASTPPGTDISFPVALLVGDYIRGTLSYFV